MKIRSAVPGNGCLVFFAANGKSKKQKKNICNTYTHAPHRRLRKLGWIQNSAIHMHSIYTMSTQHGVYDTICKWVMTKSSFSISECKLILKWLHTNNTAALTMVKTRSSCTNVMHYALFGSARIVQKRLGGRGGGLSAVDSRIEACMWRWEETLLNPSVGGSSPLLRNFRFLILKGRIFVDVKR